MTATKTAAPQPKYRKDYAPPAFRVESVHLTFDLRDGITHVTSKTAYARLDSSTRDLRLDGDNLVLKSVSLDGGALGAERFSRDDKGLTISNVPDTFTLEIKTELKPEENTSLEGLYRSSGNFCTQCEPHGFSKITYYPDRPDVMTTFTTRIEADRMSCPVLLSNGNCVDKGDLPGGRHFTVWEDPFPKPCYLFALVAGNLTHIHDTFTTVSGRKVDLWIYVNPGNEDKCDHAMQSLKKSMKWDEEKYGLEYDLDVFHIVAVDDFNFGGMENKSLNIFNSKAILARPDTATDADFIRIEAVVAHEYFHNWTGDRITCRDWFQLSLKEGLTVFREQCFTGDMNSETAQRIDDATYMKTYQFAEDGGPTAHPVRPDSYIEINNFYTRTIYEKGSEVIRMMHTLLGPENYRKGTDLYFARHDGQAVTCDDFAQCMQDASNIDLTQFRLWYSQAGTPKVTAKGSYNAEKNIYALTLTQSIPETPDQTEPKQPMHIPVAVGLLDGQSGKDLLPETTRVLHLTEPEQTFLFDSIPAKPVPSILRNFSAPVKLETDLTGDELLFLMASDSDGYNKWDAGQTYLTRLILSNPDSVPGALIEAFRALLDGAAQADPLLLAKTLTPPSENMLAQVVDTVDVDAIYNARKLVMSEVGKACEAGFRKLYEDSNDSGPYTLTPAAIGRRRLKALALRYLHEAGGSAISVPLAAAQFKSAGNMTDKISALALLADAHGDEARAAFDDFYNTWKSDPLVLDKWFTLQATADRPDAPEAVATLTAHPDFTYKNPNRLRALIGAFGSANAKWFHRTDGAGYRLLADTVIRVDKLNPLAASGLLTPLRQWKRYDPARREMMKENLERILKQDKVSNDVYEIVSKSLG